MLENLLISSSNDEGVVHVITYGAVCQHIGASLANLKERDSCIFFMHGPRLFYYGGKCDEFIN